MKPAPARPVNQQSRHGIPAPAPLLPDGHLARPAAARAVLVSVFGMVTFTAFAYVTTQIPAARVGSPWQSDPYDVVVSFTEFLVPVLALLTVARTSLCRRDEALPVFRLEQSLRAALVGTVLVAATIAVDWVAVAVRADHQRWNRGTPWLIASLGLLGALAATAFVLHRMAFRLLPRQKGGPPAGDWITDAVAMVDAFASRYPRLGRSLRADQLSRSAAPTFIRRHIVALAATGSVVAGLLVSTARAVGEGESPDRWPLFFAGTAMYAAGLFGFCLISNKVLQVAVDPSQGLRRSRGGPLRRAAPAAITAAALAMPAALALRDSIWTALGHHGPMNRIWPLVVVMAASSGLTGALTLVGALAVATPADSRRGG